MNGKREQCSGTKAEKFQKLVLGMLLFLSYGIQYVPGVIFVALVMLISCLFGPKYTPFYLLYTKIPGTSSKVSTTRDVKCSLDGGANRFSCGMGVTFLTASIAFLYLDHGSIGWSLALIVATLSALAGTVGFCLGVAIYALLFRGRVN
jgi:hypothetical protein